MKITKLLALSLVLALGACDQGPAEPTDPVQSRDGLPFDPGCAYNFLIENHAAGCVQETTLCLDGLLPTPCTAADPTCFDSFNKCLDAGTECMKATQP